jgi:hypothetical protein
MPESYCLPLSVFQPILSHLLPPQPPLPSGLLSRSLLDRLKFLSPDPADFDTHLTPFPSSSSQPISSRLAELAAGYELDRPTYAHDGEALLARISLRPNPLGGRGGVAVIFEFEEGANGRGWVFHSARIPEDVQQLDWVEDIAAVSQKQRGEEDLGEGVALDDYWAGFTPPTPTIELADGGKEGGEEDHWAKYRDAEVMETPLDEVPGPTDPSLHKTVPPMQALNQPRKTSSDSMTREKLLGKINVLLRQMWSDFTRDASGATDVLEERALLWLKVGRGVVTSQRGDASGEEVVLRAKMEVFAEMHELLDTGQDGDGEGFWRLIEGAIRKPVPAGLAGYGD